MLSFVFKEHVLFRVDFLSVTFDCSCFVFFAFLFFSESFVVEQQALFGVDFIHNSMISDITVLRWGGGLRSKSRIFRITSRGYTCLSGHFF